jgi:glycosyltransferase involved in cell wall biosynthesis
VKKGSVCPFGKVHFIDPSRPITKQIPNNIDVVHFNNSSPEIPVEIPYLLTIHGNRSSDVAFDKNTVFVSKNHAERFGSRSFVYNGLDWDDYGKPDLSASRACFHFLGNAAWRVKNVMGAIQVVSATPRERLFVLGGNRFNFKMGLRFTWNPRIKFYGMVGEEKKRLLLQHSKGLVFPVRWHEPFGLALIESLYFGCPVMGTPYGALPEIIHSDVGYLSNKSAELSLAIKNTGSFSPVRCHEYARDCFNAKIMALNYIDKYTKVMNKQPLNDVPPKLQQKECGLLAWE